MDYLPQQLQSKFGTLKQINGQLLFVHRLISFPETRIFVGPRARCFAGRRPARIEDK
jgi:hypothetical protein